MSSASGLCTTKWDGDGKHLRNSRRLLCLINWHKSSHPLRMGKAKLCLCVYAASISDKINYMLSVLGCCLLFQEDVTEKDHIREQWHSSHFHRSERRSTESQGESRSCREGWLLASQTVDTSSHEDRSGKQVQTCWDSACGAGSKYHSGF